MTRAPDTRELHAWETAVLDIAKCDRTEFVVALYAEFESAGVRFETWPEQVRAIMTRQVDAWIAAHPERAVCAATFAAPRRDNKQTCVLILHHSAKAAAAAEQSAASPPAAAARPPPAKVL